jgi:hypothetical protein
MDVSIYGSAAILAGVPSTRFFPANVAKCILSRKWEKNIFHFPLAIPSPLGYNTRMSNTENFQVYDALMYERVEVEEVYTQNIDCQMCYDTGTVDEGEPCYCDRGRSLILNIRSL